MKRLWFLFTVVMFFIMVSRGFASNGEWMIKSLMPTPRFDITCLVINGKIYAISGEDNKIFNQAYETVEEYNSQTDTWSVKSPFPHSGLLCSCMCVANDKIYLFKIKQVWEYTSQTDIWTGKTFLPESKILLDSGCVVIGHKIYVIIKVKKEYRVGEYNTDLDTWTVKALLPEKLNGVSKLVGVNSKIYLIGSNGGEYDPQEDKWVIKKPFPEHLGYLLNFPPTMVVKDKVYIIFSKWKTIMSITPSMVIPYEYNPQTDSWTSKTPMPTSRGDFGYVVLNDKIYTIGGYDVSKSLSVTYAQAYRNVEVYDPDTDTWTQIAPISDHRGRMGCAGVNGKIYAIGGIGISAQKTLDTLDNTVEEYTPIKETLKETLQTGGDN